MNLSGLEQFMQNQETKRQIETKNILDKIDYRQGLINEKNKIINNLNYEKELITEDIVKLVKGLNSSELSLIWGATSKQYHDAWLWNQQDVINNKNIDELKNSYKLVTLQIQDRLLLNNKKIKLKGISLYGYDETGYSFYFEYKNHTFEIYVPMFERATKENYKDMLLGYKLLIKTSEYTWDTIIRDLNYNVVAQKLKEYIENLEVEDE